MNERCQVIPVADSSGTKQPPGWATVGQAAYVKIGVISILFWLFFRTEINGLVMRWINDPTWSHGLLIPFFSLYFLNQQKTRIASLKSRTNYLGLALLIFFIFVFYPLNLAQFGFVYLQSVTMVAALGAIVLFLGGWRMIRYTWLPILYLLFAFPLPDAVLVPLTTPMRILAAKTSTVFLNMVPRLEALNNGVIIDVTYKGIKIEPPLDIAEACSGIRLLMTFFALGVAMAYLHYRPAWQRLILLGSTIVIAIISNVVRVTITGFIYVLWDPKYAQGLWHDLLGILMLPVAFGLYGLLAWFMENLFVEQQSDADIIVRRTTEKLS